MEELKFTFWNKLIGKIKSVSIENDYLVITYKNKTIQNINFNEIYSSSKIKTSILLGNNIQFIYDSNLINISFIEKHCFQEFYNFFSHKCAVSLEKIIKKITTDFLAVTEKEYLRDSNIDYADNLIKDIVEDYKSNEPFYSKYIQHDVIDELNYVISLFPVSEKFDFIRQEYEKKCLVNRKKFFDCIESNPLTEQQRLAVIRNNDINMVLAAAGTGKTSVMVAKALDIIDSGMAQSNDILILAYNKSASEELLERIKKRAAVANIPLESCPVVSTFHALGRQIILKCGLPTRITKFVEDTKLLHKWFNDWLIKYLMTSNQNMQKFLMLAYQPINVFEFKTKEEYDAFVRDNEFRTLQGEQVRGYQELLIANWLFMHSVPYEYEGRYVAKVRIDIGFDYKPDFHILNTNIYIEHFGIDREGHTRPDIDEQEYNSSIDKKRLLHKEYGTTLLETYHYEWKEDILFQKLEQLMQENSIPTKKKSSNEIFDALKDSGILIDSENIYLKCLSAIRTERLKHDSVLERLEKAEIKYAKEYTDFLMDIHDAYIKEVHGAREIDFDDMILQATDLIEKKLFIPKWKYILVDEFQDISMARLELLQAIYKNGSRPIWTVVGDDWQSIYRFSGGKLEATTRFKEIVGNFTLSKLEKTYRYNNSIADTAGTFIMENDEQYKKHVVTHNQVSHSCIHLYDSGIFTSNEKEDDNISKKALEIYKKIREERPKDSIAVLARYRYLLDNVRNVITDKNVKFWTFHGSKGLEADCCILIGFFRGKAGFPNQNKDEAVVEALLPMIDTFPHSEERRLFYVALTRAKNECYIIADPTAPSYFIDELLAPKYDIDIVSKCFQEKYRSIFKCKSCSTGYYVMKHGPYGNFYSCSASPTCKSSPRICEKCGAPSVDSKYESVCQNPSCRNTFPICEICGRPMRLREGRYGKFWGCSGYGIKNDQCTNTRKFIEDEDFRFQ